MMKIKNKKIFWSILLILTILCASISYPSYSVAEKANENIVAEQTKGNLVTDEVKHPKDETLPPITTEPLSVSSESSISLADQSQMRGTTESTLHFELKSNLPEELKDQVKFIGLVQTKDDDGKKKIAYHCYPRLNGDPVVGGTSQNIVTRTDSSKLDWIDVSFGVYSYPENYEIKGYKVHAITTKEGIKDEITRIFDYHDVNTIYEGIAFRRVVLYLPNRLYPYGRINFVDISDSYRQDFLSHLSIEVILEKKEEEKPVPPVKARLRIEGHQKTLLPATEFTVENFDLAPYAHNHQSADPVKDPIVLKELKQAHLLIQGLKSIGFTPNDTETDGHTPSTTYDILNSSMGYYLRMVGGDREFDGGLNGFSYQSGWMYSIDYHYCLGMTTEKLEEGHDVVWAFKPDSRNPFTWWDKRNLSIKPDTSVTLKLMGSSDKNTQPIVPIEGAQIFVDDILLKDKDGKDILTDNQGRVKIPGFKNEGQHYIKAEKIDKIVRPEPATIIVDKNAVEMPNHAPKIKPQAENPLKVDIEKGKPYTLDLESVFEDQDQDMLSFKVSINGKAPILAQQKFGQSFYKSGSNKLIFTANDGELTSPEYVVNVNVTEAGQTIYLAEAIGKTQSKLTFKEPSTGSIGGEWMVLGLARNNYENQPYYQKYLKQLTDLVKSKNGVLDNKKYTEYSRSILGLASIGKDATNTAGYNLIKPLGDYDKVIFQGINGPIFALLALDSRNYEMPILEEAPVKATRDMYLQYILDHEIAGGGWSLSGNKADTDITAMALQALAKYKDKPAVQSAIDRALTKLSTMQNKETGGFASMGDENLESTAQVVVALSALGINAKTDKRFADEGINPIDNILMSYYVKDGGFRHVSTGEYNQMATEQGFYALVAYDRYSKGMASLYDMSDVQDMTGEIPVDKTPTVTVTGVKDGQAFNTKDITVKIKAKDYKGIPITPTVYFNNKEIGKADEVYQLEFVKEQNILKVVAEDIDGNKNEKLFKLIYYPINNSGGGTVNPFKKIVTLSIDKETIHKGHLINEEKVEYRDGDTVWDIFQRETTRRGISFNYRFTPEYNSVYIESIAGDGEFDHGPGSGWMYSVNEVYPQVGASVYYPKEGDVIRWRYTTNLGKDIGGGMDDPESLRKLLQSYMNSAKAYSKNEYTKGTYDTLTEAIKNGGQVLNNSSSTDIELLEAIQKIDKAIKGMERLSFVQITQNYKDDLKRKIDEIEAMKIDPKKYDKITYNAFMESLKKAKEAYEKGDISYEELQKILQELEETMKELTAITPLPTVIPPVQEIKLPPVDYSYRFGDQHQISGWATEAIAKSRSYGLMVGDEQNNFNPKKPINRAEISMLLSNFMGEVSYEQNKKSFKDVSSDKWYYTAVDKAVSLGLLIGLSDDVFDPEGMLTREQLAVIIVNMMGYNQSILATPSDEEKVSGWAKDAVSIVYGRDLMVGDGVSFNPKGFVTREMAAVIMVKLYEEKYQEKIKLSMEKQTDLN